MIDDQNSDKEFKLVLFDIDGTITKGNSGHWNAFAKALKEVADIEIDKEDWSRYMGYTDTGILYDQLKRHGVDITDHLMQRLFDAMSRHFLKEDLSDMRLIDGVEDLLKEFDRHDDIIVGLVTGNLEIIAFTKMKHFHIREYFVLGGFGHISEVRSELVNEAIRQAEVKFGKIARRNVFIIGDTPRDIQAAKDAGVKVIAVATGKHTIEENKKFFPDYAFDDLKNTKRVLEVIQHG